MSAQINVKPDAPDAVRKTRGYLRFNENAPKSVRTDTKTPNTLQQQHSQMVPENREESDLLSRFPGLLSTSSGSDNRVFHCDVCADRMYRPEPGPACSFVDFDGRQSPPQRHELSDPEIFESAGER